MLKVSQKLEYAMRAMIELANRRGEGTLVPAREIAERQQIPLRFLEQQLGALSKAGLVESFRGAGGGCRIARDPAEITIGQIADAIEGQIFPMFCLEPSDHTCFQDSQCGLQGFWADVATGRPEGVRRNDGGGPIGPPPTDEPGAGIDRPGNAVVSFSLTGIAWSDPAISPLRHRPCSRCA